MASGRPVLAHQTGFTDWLDVSAGGVFPFSDEEEVINAIEVILRNPQKHGTNARRLAEAFFDYRTVLPSLIERAMP